MRILLVVIAAPLLGGCQTDSPCATDADCAGYDRAVCQAGSCVCAYDELERCLCDRQERCDSVYGAGVRECLEGACRECSSDEQCGALARCGAAGECETIECNADTDCDVGVCDTDTLDCVGCRGGVGCPVGWRCRDDGACVQCSAPAHCAVDEVCDVDVSVGEIEVVGTNVCGLDCGPRCRDECADDPDCVLRPACVVEDPACLGASCETWDGCELPETCALRLGPCPAGSSCEALAASFVTPIHYACLDTPCLFDFECGDASRCYEGLCLPACDAAGECERDEVCVARVHFDGGACLRVRD